MKRSGTAFGRSGRKSVRSASSCSRTGSSMQLSSSSIAHLAGALAKAQSELVNPQKSLTAVLERDRTGRGGQAYRYAPLSAGLDIVRKTLGKHELAVLQTTHLDRESGT